MIMSILGVGETNLRYEVALLFNVFSELLSTTLIEFDVNFRTQKNGIKSEIEDHNKD